MGNKWVRNTSLKAMSGKWWAIRDSQGAKRRNSEGKCRASHNSSSILALPKRTSQTAKSGFSLKKKNRTSLKALTGKWWAIRDSQGAKRRNSEGKCRASHNSSSLSALPKRTSQTAKSEFSLKKKKPDKPKGDVRKMVGNKGLEPLTFSTSRRHSPN